MTTYAIIGGGFVLILAVIWLAYLAGRGKGGSDQRAGNADATAETRAREQEAAAKAPADKAAVIDTLRKGKF
ncbi:hypothetical protein FRZ44_37810 [Hypericibacter terrae]|uniref:Uncharacterized protein n=2 Tax=Hypericibacter terrae TaxID=2602015 RepID=A0A5J6MM05_9PROT|nr:hypothetical protein FRZ44_37810 [Hypericibacter terrae]